MKKFIYHLFLSLIIVEACGYLLSLLNLEPTGFKVYYNTEAFDNSNGYADRDSLVGVWHKPNDTWVHNAACFTAEMHSNQYGATDNRWDTSKTGLLFLGSSFIEGFGMNYGKRVSEKYEELTGKEVFNCGMAGDFSPVQYYMTLKKFGHILKFDTCVVFIILPTDDSLVTTIDESRYRPYLSDKGIEYTRSHSKFPEYKKTQQKLELFFNQFCYSFHLYSYFKNRNYLKSRLLLEQPVAQQDYPQVKRIINKICDDFPDKYFYFVFTPTLSQTNLPQNMEKKSNMQIIDITGSLNNKSDYLICNSHWNASGHAKVARALYEAIAKQKK